MSKDGLWVLAAVISILVACAVPTPEAGDKIGAEPRVAVAATSWPVAWLVEQIAGDRVDWRGRSMLDLERGQAPSADQLLELATADRIFVQGAGWETWREIASLPESRVVDTTAGVVLIEEEGPTHSHGAEGEHSHRRPIPGTWLDPELFRGQARKVMEALVGASHDEAAKALLVERHAALDRTLVTLAADLRSVLSAAPSGSHWGSAGPGLEYLARGYGLELEVHELLADAAPDEHETGHVRAWARSGAPAILLWPKPPVAEVAAALDGSIRHVVFDPLTAPSPGGRYDWAAGMRANLERLHAAVSEK